MRAAPTDAKAHVVKLVGCMNCTEHTQSAGQNGASNGRRNASVSLLLTSLDKFGDKFGYKFGDKFGEFGAKRNAHVQMSAFFKF